MLPSHSLLEGVGGALGQGGVPPPGVVAAVLVGKKGGRAGVQGQLGYVGPVYRPLGGQGRTAGPGVWQVGAHDGRARRHSAPNQRGVPVGQGLGRVLQGLVGKRRRLSP